MFSMAYDIGPRIRKARLTYRDVGMAQNKLAEELGVSSARLHNWESGKHDPAETFVAKAARVLEVSARWLLTGEAGEEPQPAKMMGTKPLPVGRLPLYNAASAGMGNASSVHDTEVEVPAQLCRPDYGALYVEGDSMTPLLRNGDVAVFQNVSEARPGQIIAVTVGEEGSEEWLIKVVTRATSGVLALASINEAYEAIVGSFTIHGRLVGIYRVEGPEYSVRHNPFGIKAA